MKFKMNKKQRVAVIIILLIVALSISVVSVFSPPNTKTKKLPMKACENIERHSVKSKVPAVEKSGEGILLNLEVGVMPGSGKVLTDINNLLFWVDTQKSINTAKEVAEKVTGINTSNIDISYTLRAGKNTTAVGGGSAGGILTLATIAALKEKPLNESIVTTGTVNEEGDIGEVGGIEAKIRAAKRAGAKLFLLPEGQGTQEILKPVKECEESEGMEICEINYKQREVVPVEKELNITIKEVSNISEAMRYYDL